MSKEVTVIRPNISTYVDPFNADVLVGPEPFQLMDLRYLERRKHHANWSQMGAKKTSTGLWLMMRQTRNIENPSAIVVTTKSGKGAILQLAPHILQDWYIFDVEMNYLSLVKDGKRMKLELPVIPEKFNFPCLCVCHYNMFAVSNKDRYLTDTGRPDGNVVLGKDGEPIPMPKASADFALDRDWDFVWLDEAHRIKNKDGKWTVNIKNLKGTYRHVSTGTGFINRPDEIWSLLNFLDRKTFGSYWRFRDTFVQETVINGIRYIDGIKPAMVQTFRDLVRTYGPRHTLTEVMPHIKEPIFVRREVELSKIQLKMYKSIKNELKALDKKGVPFHSPNVLSALQRMRQIAVATPEVVSDVYDEKQDRRVLTIKLVEPSSKLDAVIDLLDESDDDQLFVIFSNFRDPLELLKARLDNRKFKNYKYLHMQTHHTPEEREKMWAVDFPTKKYKIFMSTLQLGGESINLTPASYMIFLDRSWSPAANNQGIGRIRRPGQTGQPVVINIEAKGTVDRRVEHVVNIKQGWFGEIFDNEKEDE